MKKLLKNTDFQFVIMILAVLLVHTFFLFAVPFSDDESHYATVPFRLLNGDSLVQHEWHLTQFASLFSYLPVRIWTAIKGSADGIIIFLRCFYLAIHTSVAALVYRFFREHGKWAVLASMVFYAQVSYGIQAISYQSMFAVFTLLLALCLMSIYKKQSAKSYIFAGICYGCCCVCNPLFCMAFVLYLIGCALWTQRDTIKEFFIGIRSGSTAKKGKKLTKKQKKEQKKQVLESFPELENYNCFFNKKAILRFILGIAIIAVVAATFFFLTGGTIDSIFDNIENLMNSSEYDIASNSVFSKFLKTIQYFSIANFHMPWILPLLFIVVAFDKNRKNNTHRFAYLAATVLWMILYIVGIVVNTEIYLCALSLPFFVFSLMCYALTEKKNKSLFFCMLVPCLIATFFHYIAADTHLAAVGVVLAVTNAVSALFIMDLWKEVRSASTEDSESVSKNNKAAIRNIIIVAFSVQILFYSAFYHYGQFFGNNSPRATTGPYKGLRMSEIQYESYNDSINDLNVIKSLSDEDDPVLIGSFRNWMYMHLDRPFATYTTWYRGALDVKLLTDYYTENPGKIPKYIYLDTSGTDEAGVQFIMDKFSGMFEFKRQDLSNGVLLIVEKSYLRR